MKKTILLAAVLAMFFFPLSAFAGGKQESKGTGDAGTDKAAVVRSADFNSVKDELGRDVKVPKNPKRILALTSAVMEACYNLDLELVGKVEEYRIREKGIALQSVGKTGSINMEAVTSLAPDLIIASSRYHGNLVSQLEQTKAAVFFFDPDGVGDMPIVQLPTYIGNILGKNEAGKKYEEKILSLAAGLKAEIAQAGIISGVMIQDSETVSAVQRITGYGTIFSLLGIRNIVPDNLPNAKRSPYVTLDAEQLVKANPSVVLIIASSRDKAANMAALQRFKSDPKWAGMDAVTKGRVWILPFAINPNRATMEQMLKACADIMLEKNKNQ